MKEFFRFKQMTANTIISIIVYVLVSLLVGEYIITPLVPIWIQLLSLFVMGLYTIWQIRYVAKYFIHLLKL